ncbi:MAG: GDP-mannose 4,6-dehydratase [Devosia sp.]|uniref:NAD-dependent epimerase/dehydratase family protein n=1 Tax=Devosia sp. TaxID=1871048 RepID=UPI001A3C6372|nr:NAD-dependent epimerase/dehydratase family protein [Devosia sp.]MBL8597601.1 GDP-mannose 4,6-dehydratase [Devosia sp.]
MKVFITGSAGFIGFHLARRLLGEGHTVFGLDSFSPYYDVNLKRRRHAMLAAESAFSATECALEDRARVTEAVAAFEPDVAVHLAAQAGVRASIDDPLGFVSTNVTGTMHLLEALRTHRPQHVVMASSSSVYGTGSGVPRRESESTDIPISPYAATKKAAEVLSHSHAHLFGIPVTCLRIFTAYGPWGRPDMALLKFTGAIEAGSPIDIYGRGAMKRDFTFVDDLVESIRRLIDVVPGQARVSALDSLSPVAPWRVVNIGNGSPVGLLDFVETIERAMGRKAVKTYLDMQPGDATDTWADIALLEELTGCRPATSLAEGVERTVRWYRDQRG